MPKEDCVAEGQFGKRQRRQKCVRQSTEGGPELNDSGATVIHKTVHSNKACSIRIIAAPLCRNGFGASLRQNPALQQCRVVCDRASHLLRVKWRTRRAAHGA